ncbi:MAG: hypothetical protein ACTSUS_09670 [Candidatus Freyarchaeota archaeon]|nr:hypothetical protein [Candidatus Freyrarchaeum guaymaensis]
MRPKFFVVGQIDATCVGSPHQRELEELGAAKFPLLKSAGLDEVRRIVHEDLGGRFDELGMGEDWAFTLRFFPEVNVHILYYYYGDEFGDIEGELKFLFSGDRAYWVPGEDLVTYISIVLDFMESRLKGWKQPERAYGGKSGLMVKLLEERREPFKLLEEEDAEKMGEFVGAEVAKSGSTWSIKKEVFPQIFIEIIYDREKDVLDVSYSGENLFNIGRYSLELIGTFIVNHAIRFITVKHHGKRELPSICYKMFSRMFTKEKCLEPPHSTIT